MTARAEEIDTFIIEVLDGVEQTEAHLLVWGLVDGRITRQELERLINPILDRALDRGMSAFIEASEVIAELLDRALLFATDDNPYPGYRSRMAETVRLLFRLRQLFPKHAGPDRWQNAATLVADFRFLWRRRRYPNRDVALEGALEKVGAAARDNVTQAALTALLGGRGENFLLAGFQIRAAERIMDALAGRRQSGTLVSAGTGSGKTLAFYLPALARTVSHLMRDRTSWVKVLALYPRIELLRDQFAEIYAEARRLDEILGRGRARSIRIGCLFSGTPHSARFLDPSDPPQGWKEADGGMICGYMPCPVCSSELLWPTADREADSERLVCRTCAEEIDGDRIALTRASMRRNPPDLLFTTTEMLNQRMADDGLRHLFGLAPQARRPVEMVLLDEVHYYSGSNGAQIAYLLRRWQHLVRTPVCFVGLSATLRDGARFFARLTGLPDQCVAEIAPGADEMVDEGAEHMIALRGDPVSRTSLLSTTIQTAMLMMRSLDHGTNPRSRGRYGHRAFAFTDDLDVTNRLYFSLLDAEGRNHLGDPDMVRHPRGPLAALRTTIPSRSRDRFGQNWTMPELVGHPLQERKRVGRTSSQDPGVASNADIVVATASLEVGFNDPTVGVVIQHKAPRGAAQFLQRKGRAGRVRKMRPWTVVVLSDYGRDRLAYQGYDRLFDPELPPQTLPLSSRHIRRIQSVYTLIDYLGRDGRNNRPRGNAWWDLSGPRRETDARDRRDRFDYLMRVLAAILENETDTEALATYIGQALALPPEEVLPLLWEHPRPLLTTVIPTALRRLGTNWRRGPEPRRDYQVFNSPLPEFAPAQLFGDLNLPEVVVIVQTRPGARDEDHPMPVAAAMREFAPGRVSRRFGTSHGSIRHWIGPDQVPAAAQAEIDIATFYDARPLGQWQRFQEGQIISVPVFRPYELRPVRPPRNVRDSSNARLIWSTQIVAEGRGLFQEAPRGTPWAQLILGIECFLHAEQSPVEYRRFASSSDADVQIERQDGIRVRFGYRSAGEEAALGFSLSVDALRFTLSIPRELWRRTSPSSEAMWRALRSARFLDAARSGEAIDCVENPFARRWLAEIYLTALTFDAMVRNVSLSEADVALRDGTAALVLTDVLDAIFQSAPPDADAAQHVGSDVTDRLRRDLEQFLHRGDVLAALHDHGRLLWEDPGEDWEPWLRRRFKATIGAAALEAVRNLCPDIGDDGLVVDCDTGPRLPEDALPAGDADDEIWISETSPGGTGLIEVALESYAEDPRRFYQLMAAALRPTEHELVDHQLMLALVLLTQGPPSGLKIVVDDYRAGRSSDAASATMARLRHQLREEGFALFHSFISAMANRVLRSGTSSASDNFLRRAIEHWEAEEARLGIEIEATSVAYALAQDSSVDQIMAAVGLTPPTDNVRAWRHNAIYGLLWPRGAAVRRNRLNLYNPFAQTPEAERLLVADYLAEGTSRIPLTSGTWRGQLLERLAFAGTVTLVCPASDAGALADALNFLATNPVVSDYLSVFARLGTLRRVADTYEADLELAEFAQ